MADKRIIPDHLMSFWAGSESTFGAGPSAAPLPVEAIRHISTDAPLMVAREVKVEDATGHRGRAPSIAGAYDPVAIRLLLPIRGPGTPVSTGPEFDALFKAAALTPTIAAGAVTYRRSLADVTSAWIWGATSDGTLGQAYAGIGCTEINLPDIGTDQAKIDLGLQAAKGATVYRTTLAAPAAIGVTSLTLPTGHGWVIAGAPAWIRVAKADNSSSEVMKVTAVTGTAATVVRAQADTVAASWTTGDIITAYVPTRTESNVPPLGEIGGGFTLNDGGGAKARQFTKASLSIKTGVDLLEKPALESYRDGLSVAKYGDDAASLTADLTYTVGADGVAFLHRVANDKTLIAVEMTIGSATGNRVKVSLPKAQVTSLAAPDTGDGPRKGTAIFGAFSTDGSDVVIVFD